MTFNDECVCLESGLHLVTLPCKHRIHRECVKKMKSDQCPWCRAPMGLWVDERPRGGGCICNYKCVTYIITNIILSLYYVGWCLYINYGVNYSVSIMDYVKLSVVCVCSFFLLNSLLYCMFRCMPGQPVEST